MEKEEITKEEITKEEIIKEIKIKSKDLFSDEYNKAVFLSDEEQQDIAQKVIETYETDKKSRQDREEKWKNIVEIIKEEERDNTNSPKINKARVIYPLIKEACKRVASEMYPVIFQDGNIVKAKPIGNDEGEISINPVDGQPLLDITTQQPVYKRKPGKKVAKAQRRVEFDNFIILNHIENYEKNTDELLYRLGIYGTYFKKIYFCQTEKKIKIDVLFPDNVIVNNNAQDNKYTVYSQELYLMYNDIISRQKTGIFLEVNLYPELETRIEKSENTEVIESDFADEKECPQLLIEQHRWLDLDNDGFLEPYIVVVHKSSEKLLGIYMRYTEDDIIKEDKKIVNIKPREYFIKYSFFPSVEGEYYSEGLGDLLYHTNHVSNTLINQLVDSGTLSNRSQGFLSKALKKRAGNINLGIGEWMFLDTFGINMREAIYQIDHKEPSVVLFSLLQFILQSAKDLAGTQPVLGENPGNIAPMTMMSIIQQGTKELKAVYKRIYMSIRKEIKMIEDIIRDNNDNMFSEMYVEVLDDKEADFINDYNEKSYDVIPVADANMITNFEKNAKVRFILSLLENPVAVPYLKVENIIRDVLSAINYPNISNIVQTPPPPPPDPAIETLKIQQQIELEKVKSDRMRIEIALQETRRKIAESALKAKESGIKEVEIEAKIENIKADSMNKIANTDKILAEAGKTLKETQTITEQLYEPKNKKI